MAEVVHALETGTSSTLLGGALARDAIGLCQRQTESAIGRKPVDV